MRPSVAVTDRLTGLDSSFLHLERDGTHMHVASTTLFEGPAPPYLEFRDHIESRLHLVPRFRQKLRFVPFGQGRPVWVDDPHLNLAYHVRHTSLPEPGSEQQLRVLAARIFSQQLDRSKPLWELWLIEGLKGNRFAIVGKTHHAMVDGVSGVDITTVLFDMEKDPIDPPRPPERWVPKPEPNGVQLLGEALVQRAVDPREIFRGVRRVVRGPRRALRKATEAVVAAGSFAWTGVAAPRSPFNFDVGPHRRFAWVRASLSDMKQVKNELGGTVNDVILAAVAGALGRYMRSRGHATVGARAARDGAGQRADLRPARQARQSGDRDDGVASGLVRGPGAPNGDRPRVDGRPEGLEAGDGRHPDHPAGGLRAADRRRPGRPPAVPAALLQPRGHQHPGPPVPALS